MSRNDPLLKQTDSKTLGAAPLPADLVGRFTVAGIAIIEYALTKIDLAQMDALFPRLAPRTAGARASDFTPDAQAWLASHIGLSGLAARLSGGQTRLSRIQAFDKSPMTNWFVPWHQDRAEGGLDRSVCQLERTVALRIHLDDCNEDNGPLEVLPRSHTEGRLESVAIASLVETISPLLCLTVRGDIIAMRPLLVHRSQRARIPRSRRVLHLEYERLT
jgi:hypothetical protein